MSYMSGCDNRFSIGTCFMDGECEWWWCGVRVKFGRVVCVVGAEMGTVDPDVGEPTRLDGLLEGGWM